MQCRCLSVPLFEQTNRTVAHLESEMRKLQETANLFEVSFPDYKQLRQCRSDLILLKAVWDMVVFVKVVPYIPHLLYINVIFSSSYSLQLLDTYQNIITFRDSAIFSVF